MSYNIIEKNDCAIAERDIATYNNYCYNIMQRGEKGPGIEVRVTSCRHDRALWVSMWREPVGPHFGGLSIEGSED